MTDSFIHFVLIIIDLVILFFLIAIEFGKILLVKFLYGLNSINANLFVHKLLTDGRKLEDMIT